MWRGGCIIRSTFLGEIKKAFVENPDLKCLLLDKYFLDKLQVRFMTSKCCLCILHMTVLSNAGIPYGLAAHSSRIGNVWTTNSVPVDSTILL